MRQVVRHRLLLAGWLIAIGSLIAAFVIDSQFTTTFSTCADGWSSPSIGRQGACSHHGGVTLRVIDHRGVGLKYLEWALVALGCATLAFLLWLAKTFKPDGNRIPKNRPLRIQGDRACVPLTIAQEERLVDVIKRNERLYETVDDVAIVRGGNRTGRYRARVSFVRRDDGTFDVRTLTWINTNRGRERGYWATAVAWRQSADEVEKTHSSSKQMDPSHG